MSADCKCLEEGAPDGKAHQRFVMNNWDEEQNRERFSCLICNKFVADEEDVKNGWSLKHAENVGTVARTFKNMSYDFKKL